MQTVTIWPPSPQYTLFGLHRFWWSFIACLCTGRTWGVITSLDFMNTPSHKAANWYWNQDLHLGSSLLIYHTTLPSGLELSGLEFKLHLRTLQEAELIPKSKQCPCLWIYMLGSALNSPYPLTLPSPTPHQCLRASFTGKRKTACGFSLG